MAGGIHRLPLRRLPRLPHTQAVSPRQGCSIPRSSLCTMTTNELEAFGVQSNRTFLPCRARVSNDVGPSFSHLRIPSQNAMPGKGDSPYRYLAWCKISNLRSALHRHHSVSASGAPVRSLAHKSLSCRFPPSSFIMSSYGDCCAGREVVPNHLVFGSEDGGRRLARVQRRGDCRAGK